jgi:hypothetical protein
MRLRLWRAGIIATVVVMIFGGVSAAEAQTQTVTAMWDANSDSYTIGYRLYYGTTSGNYTQNVNVGNVTSYPLTLTQGFTYYFVVRAYNASSQLGPASNEASITLTTSTAPPTATLTGTLSGTNTANVSWTTTNATSITLNGTAVAASGSATFTISTATTYTLVATGPGGSVTRTVTVTPAPTATLTATLSGTNTANVSWTTANATSVTLNGAAVAVNGSATFTISTTTTYTLVATGPGGSVTRTRTVTPAPTASLTATLSGTNTANVSWATTNATTVTLNGAAVAASGSASFTISASTTYTLVATGPGGSVTRTATVTPSGAPTASITGSLSGSTATVSWNTTNATSATINNIAVQLSGTAQVQISQTTTFTLVATGPGGTATASTTVTVPVDCVTSDWTMQSATEWSTCSGGQQTRTETWVRTVIRQPSGGGAACGPLEETRVGTRSCTETTNPAPDAPVNLRSSVSGTKVTLNWSRATTGGAPTGYRIYVGTWPGGSNIVSGLNVGNTLTVSGDLSRGTYYARVRAYNAAGISPDSNEVTFRVGAKARPRRPLNTTGSLQNAVATLSWQPPAGDAEDAPTGYVIEAGTASGLTNLATVPVGNVTSFQARVPPGVYYVRVRAVNDLGASDPSNEVVLRDASAVGRPTNLVQSGTGFTVTLTWLAPTAGAFPAGYVIEAGTAPGLANLAVLHLGNATTFTTVAPPGVYYVRVRAKGADGSAGEASNEVIVRR